MAQQKSPGLQPWVKSKSDPALKGRPNLRTRGAIGTRRNTPSLRAVGFEDEDDDEDENEAPFQDEPY
jgi:hypothetical protein